ncbi:hypothetical protein LHGZ1_2654 [Laribacter hongkongensis]|uniref:Uncharacterized protein n=1 Tax=Laribacter hongkongensis TaxID=168471 RepID=A0A248LLP9_9NEIS|nr:hypothetical protein LHGZ1_2654 [Laribacter hongkongensis]
MHQATWFAGLAQGVAGLCHAGSAEAGWGMDCLCQVTFVGDLPFLPPVCACCLKFVLAPRCKPP